MVTGGTGSLGSRLVRRLLHGDLGRPEEIVVFSRDEVKQHAMRLALAEQAAATDEIIDADWRRIVRFHIGDVADPASIRAALRGTHVVFNTAGLKQVPTCEYFPAQAVRTNVLGPEQIVRAIGEGRLPVEAVIGISTDKACKPVNVMGMTKALQERVFIQANLDCAPTRFVIARYGNLLAARGSVIPVFHDQIRRGGPLTLTTPDMTRFFMTLDQAVDTAFAALKEARPGEIYVPRVPSARMVDLAAALIGGRRIGTVVTGIRPGEKVHEILISEEESSRTVARGSHLVIKPMLPELAGDLEPAALAAGHPFSSADHLLDRDGVEATLRHNRLLVE